MGAVAKKEEISAANSEYWNTLCGSELAKMLGIEDLSARSLAKFDAYYMGYYPYLLKHVPIEKLWNKHILEVGLGYGTLSQQLATVASCYAGLDIAKGPVEVVNHRIQTLGLNGKAEQGSILEPTLPEHSFDAVVSIGCLHHTGDLPLAITQAMRLLKPGGTLYAMVYNAYSYRRWLQFTRSTIRHALSENLGMFKGDIACQKERDAYDTGAPETTFASTAQLRTYLRGAGGGNIVIRRENAAPEGLFSRWSRERMLETIAPYYGLDLYMAATKR